MSNITKADVDKVRAARWESWRRLAKELPDHHILSIELLRTSKDDTVAVFTVVRNHQPVQYVLRADAQGGNVRAIVSQKHPPIQVKAKRYVETALMASMASTLDDGGVSADSIALGEPPPKEPPPPGIIALGTSLLTTSFDLGEVAASSEPPR